MFYHSSVATLVSIKKSLSRKRRNTAEILSFYPLKDKLLDKKIKAHSKDQLFRRAKLFHQEEEPLQLSATALWPVLIMPRSLLH